MFRSALRKPHGNRMAIRPVERRPQPVARRLRRDTIGAPQPDALRAGR